MQERAELYRYLRARRRLYRTGIPCRLFTSPAQGDSAIFGAPKSGLACVVYSRNAPDFYDSPEGQLLTAALEKGLKLNRDDVLVIARASRADSPEQVPSEGEVRCVITFGEEVRELAALFPEAAHVSTLSLTAVGSNPELKRSLWKDLQCAASKLA